jgi:ubiquitin-conjugating enzyme E2 variant
MQRPVEHARHHAGDKNTAYCVLTPFVNPVLDALGFWRAIERVVVPIFGAPRREDLRNRVW